MIQHHVKLNITGKQLRIIMQNNFIHNHLNWFDSLLKVNGEKLITNKYDVLHPLHFSVINWWNFLDKFNFKGDVHEFCHKQLKALTTSSQT